MQSYLRQCSDTALVPALMPFLTGHSSKLLAGGRQLQDRDLQAIVAAVSSAAGVEAVDVSDNAMLTDRALVPLLRELGRASGDALASLSLRCCRGAGPGTALALAELLGGSGAGLRQLNINGIRLAVAAQLPLCKAIAAHSALTSVSLAETGLYGSQTSQCVDLILGNSLVEVLDLGWNCFTAGVFSAMGAKLAENDSLRSLCLCNAAAACKGEPITSIVYLLEQLSRNRGLTHLDVSLNRLDFRGSLVLEDALQKHKKLSELNVSQNPLGVIGMRSMLRLLSEDHSGLVHFACEECTSDVEGQSATVFQVYNATNPGGRYTLDCSTPYHRTLMRMLCKTAERMQLAPNEAFSAISMQPPPFTQPEKGPGGLWRVPTRGKLTATFSIEKGMGKGLSDRWSFGELLRRHMDTVRRKPGFRKAVCMLTQWKSVSSQTLEQLVMLDALAKDFCLLPSYVGQLCQSREMVGEIVWRLFSCIDGGQQGRFLAMLDLPSLGDYVSTLRRVHSLLVFNAENPTGHYKFDLANPADFSVTQQLLLINRWETALAQELRRVDVSQRGDRSCFLNEYHQEKALPASMMIEWNTPEYGLLEFDYVSGKRQSVDAPPLDAATFNDLLVALYGSPCPAPDQIGVLRAVSHHVNLRSLQLRQLLGVYESGRVRADLFVLLYFRVVDIQDEKIFRAAFQSAKEHRGLQQRLGFATTFPFIQPEQTHFEFDLRFNDQRVAALALFKLMAAEKWGNLKDAEYAADDEGGPMDETNFWRAAKEVSLEKCPCAGTFTGRYICAPEDRDFKTRRGLLETYGFRKLQAGEADVRWWASLFETPQEVLEFVEWLVPRFPDLTKAFHEIDGSVEGGSFANDQVTLKEFEGGLEKLGCKKFAGPDEKESIAAVFRFLDPTGEGTISKGEWGVLELLYREIRLSISEFVWFLQRTVGGGLEQWWGALDHDGSGEISFKEWKSACKKLGFYGATKQIFKYMDKDDQSSVSFEEFRELEAFSSRAVLD